MFRTRPLISNLAAFLMVSVVGIPVALAQTVGDQAFFRMTDGTDTLSQASLPRGPLVQGPELGDVPMGFQIDLSQMTHSPEGELVILQVQFPEVPGPLAFGLYTAEEDGSLEHFGAGPIFLDFDEYPMDLAYSRDGRLFVLVEWLTPFHPPSLESRLLEVDPVTSTVVAPSSML